MSSMILYFYLHPNLWKACVIIPRRPVFYFHEKEGIFKGVA